MSSMVAAFVNRRHPHVLAAVVSAFTVLGGLAQAAWGADGSAPGAPGQVANWTQGDKDGFGTATALASKAWFTLDDGEMTEVYYPDLGTPSVRSLEFVVSDGRTFTEREREDALHEVRLVDRRSLT